MANTITRIALVSVLLSAPAEAAAHTTSLSINFPSYLLTDPLFWFFSAANFIFICTFVLAITHLGGKESTDRNTGTQATRGVALLLVLGIGYQIFHQGEHVAQVYQFWHLGRSAAESAGILWFANIEWNHFIFNAGYYVLLVTFIWSMLRGMNRASIRPDTVGMSLIAGFLLIQGWHLLEHTVRIISHLSKGCEPCPGILDRMFGWGLIYLHFWLNQFALALPASIFVHFGFYRRYIPHRLMQNKNVFLALCCRNSMPLLFSSSLILIVLMVTIQQ